MTAEQAVAVGEAELRHDTLSAASAATAALLDLLEAARGDAGDIALRIETSEIAENLTDALQFVLAVQVEQILDPERKEMVGQLLADARRFLEGWA